MYRVFCYASLMSGGLSMRACVHGKECYGTHYVLLAQRRLGGVEGLGKGFVIIICRSLLYQQFDKTVMVAIGLLAIAFVTSRASRGSAA